MHDVKLHYSGFVEAFGEIHTSILCQMDAARFPFDAHSCAIRLDSYDSIELAALVDEVTAPALPHVSGWLTSNIQLGDYDVLSLESYNQLIFFANKRLAISIHFSNNTCHYSTSRPVFQNHCHRATQKQVGTITWFRNRGLLALEWHAEHSTRTICSKNHEN